MGIAGIALRKRGIVKNGLFFSSNHRKNYFKREKTLRMLSLSLSLSLRCFSLLCNQQKSFPLVWLQARTPRHKGSKWCGLKVLKYPYYFSVYYSRLGSLLSSASDELTHKLYWSTKLPFTSLFQRSCGWQWQVWFWPLPSCYCH